MYHHLIDVELEPLVTPVSGVLCISLADLNREGRAYLRSTISAQVKRLLADAGARGAEVLAAKVVDRGWLCDACNIDNFGRQFVGEGLRMIRVWLDETGLDLCSRRSNSQSQQ